MFLKKIKPMLSNNSIMVFDELVNYPEYKKGELRAIWDVFKTVQLKLYLVAFANYTKNLKTTYGHRQFL